MISLAWTRGLTVRNRYIPIQECSIQCIREGWPVAHTVGKMDYTSQVEEIFRQANLLLSIPIWSEVD